MDDLTTLFFLITIATVITAYVAKHGNTAVSGFGAVAGICTMCMIVLDGSITGWHLSLTLIPTILLTGLAVMKALEDLT